MERACWVERRCIRTAAILDYNHGLLTEPQLERFEVVLVSPRNPLNIGAAARAMANFGFSHLTVVAPYEPHWREAKSAVGASDLLQNAKRVERLTEAAADCTLVVGTGTLEHRRPEQTMVALPDLGLLITQELDRGGRVALVFGPEKRGLTREDLALCHVLVEIPTDPRQPSMNLGQAVAVCLYELAARGKTDAHPSDKNKDVASIHPADKDLSPPQEAKIASRGPRLSAGAPVMGHPDPDDGDAAPAYPRDPACARDLELLAGVVAETMQAAKYSPAAMQKANRHDLDLLLRRLQLERRDARRILGLFRRILWRLKHRIGLKD
jgi:tRNA/rRNA methyltransferase